MIYRSDNKTEDRHWPRPIVGNSLQPGANPEGPLSVLFHEQIRLLRVTDVTIRQHFTGKPLSPKWKRFLPFMIDGSGDISAIRRPISSEFQEIRSRPDYDPAPENPSVAGDYQN